MNHQNGSDYDKLFYPFLFDGGKADRQAVLGQVQQSTIKKCEDVITLRRESLKRNSELLIETSSAIAQSFTKGATLFAFGNGGSTTDAQDVVVDLLNPPYPDWQRLPAIALTNDISVLTAVGNDVGFDNIFARQIIALAREGDIALGFSTSGNSKNVVVALEQAKKQKMLTIAITGYNGGAMTDSSVVDFCLTAPSDYVPRIQEAHATIYHTMLHLVQATLKTA